jgi:hypothetical protein
MSICFDYEFVSVILVEHNYAYNFHIVILWAVDIILAGRCLRESSGWKCLLPLDRENILFQNIGSHVAYYSASQYVPSLP